MVTAHEASQVRAACLKSFLDGTAVDGREPHHDLRRRAPSCGFAWRRAVLGLGEKIMVELQSVWNCELQVGHMFKPYSLTETTSAVLKDLLHHESQSLRDSTLQMQITWRIVVRHSGLQESA